MADDFSQRAEELDKMRLMGIAKKLTLEEAQNIVTVWGIFLEHCGFVMLLFVTDIPESLLPYPRHILQGALNKMESYCYEQGLHDRVQSLEGTEAMLLSYTNDLEAIKKASVRFSNEKWQEIIASGLKRRQESQGQDGFLVNGKLWKLSKSRIEELEK